MRRYDDKVYFLVVTVLVVMAVLALLILREGLRKCCGSISSSSHYYPRRKYSFVEASLWVLHELFYTQTLAEIHCVRTCKANIPIVQVLGGGLTTILPFSFHTSFFIFPPSIIRPFHVTCNIYYICLQRLLHSLVWTGAFLSQILTCFFLLLGNQCKKYKWW